MLNSLIIDIKRWPFNNASKKFECESRQLSHFLYLSHKIACLIHWYQTRTFNSKFKQCKQKVWMWVKAYDWLLQRRSAVQGSDFTARPAMCWQHHFTCQVKNCMCWQHQFTIQVKNCRKFYRHFSVVWLLTATWEHTTLCRYIACQLKN